MPIRRDKEDEFFALCDGAAPRPDQFLSEIYDRNPAHCAVLCDRALNLIVALDERIAQQGRSPADALVEEFVRIEKVYQFAESNLGIDLARATMWNVLELKQGHALFLSAMIVMLDEYWTEGDDPDVQDVLFGPMTSKMELTLAECEAVRGLTSRINLN